MTWAPEKEDLPVSTSSPKHPQGPDELFIPISLIMQMSSEPKHMLCALPQDGDNMVLMGEGRKGSGDADQSPRTLEGTDYSRGSHFCGLFRTRVGQVRLPRRVWLSGLAKMGIGMTNDTGLSRSPVVCWF